MLNIKRTRTISISEFYNWYKDDNLKLSPKYQRGLVWNEKAKSYFLDTIIKGLPSPSIFIREHTNPIEKKTKREVIDGQQRMNAIIEFVDNKFTILKTHNKIYAGVLYSDLPEEVQKNILSYELPTEVILIDDDSQIYDMFQRLNTNNMTLNAQELRNAKYWGDFKTFITNQAEIYRSFFIDIKMFNSKELVRMKEFEYISSLSINLIQGVVDENKAKIDAVYQKYDLLFSEVDEVSLQLKDVITKINDVFENKPIIKKSFFSTKNYFYTLFNIIKENIPRHTIEYISIQLERIISIYEQLEEGFSIDENLKAKIIRLKYLHVKRTTSAKERKERIALLLELINSVG